MTYYPSVDSVDMTFEALATALLPAVDCVEWYDSIIYIDSLTQSFYLNSGRLRSVRDSSKSAFLNGDRFEFPAAVKDQNHLSEVTPTHGIKFLDGRAAPAGALGYALPVGLFNGLAGITFAAIQGGVTIPDTAANNQDILSVKAKSQSTTDLGLIWANNQGLGSLIHPRTNDGSYASTVTNAPSHGGAGSQNCLVFSSLNFLTGAMYTQSVRISGSPVINNTQTFTPMPQGFLCDEENFEARLFCRPGSANRQWKQLLRSLVAFPAYLTPDSGTGQELFDHMWAKLAALPISNPGI